MRRGRFSGNVGPLISKFNGPPSRERLRQARERAGIRLKTLALSHESEMTDALGRDRWLVATLLLRAQQDAARPTRRYHAHKVMQARRGGDELELRVVNVCGLFNGHP
jgi:hypothetical protein